MVKELLGWNRMKAAAIEHSQVASNICFESRTADEALTNVENTLSL